jgi:hypothetical protein
MRVLASGGQGNASPHHEIRQSIDTTMWLALALIASVCVTVPSSAQESDVTTRRAQIAELSRAGKYSEAIPLAGR